MTQPNDWNTSVIDEFRANGGKVSAFPANNLLLLHHTGARSGQERVSPLAYLPVDGGYAIFASKAGAPDNPAWYYNLQANPEATVEIGTDAIPVTARVASSEEREPIWTRQKELQPGFAEYEQKTSRQIPVVILEPARG
ncbi:MAG TPA: nitroreductase family deazaflavin-dependent oxidoreductase [Streptosporangiaceae bacterium]|nr:nitroreductase family deazaflavin-dependent oxidoreductase [Streptosporangiaceae bacterium]